ncbi:small ribosomal subunit protein uS14m-like [Ornithodoros turicata]|uniref:small ribosomal subunit protein uS14m-like n=1 Tax=Ornithodoros turicata TaxID=34597 RepID=UPI003138DD1F
MNVLRGAVQCTTTLLNACKTQAYVPYRTMYTDWRMARDAKRRRIVKEYARLRININSIRKNDVLPKSLQEIADKEIAALPIDSCFTRIHGRCVVTSRSRGWFRPWRLSRHMFRHLSDYNYLSGIQRAMW